MTKHVIGALTEVSTRLSEQQKQIESLLAEATANAVHILDETSKFEENHLRRLKEIEEVVAKQSLDRQSNTISVHSRLEMLQAQVGLTCLSIKGGGEGESSTFQHDERLADRF